MYLPVALQFSPRPSLTSMMMRSFLTTVRLLDVGLAASVTSGEAESTRLPAACVERLRNTSGCEVPARNGLFGDEPVVGVVPMAFAGVVPNNPAKSAPMIAMIITLQRSLRVF